MGGGGVRGLHISRPRGCVFGGEKICVPLDPPRGIGKRVGRRLFPPRPIPYAILFPKLIILLIKISKNNIFLIIVMMSL